ncbi:MAG: cell division protein FtsL [Peptococcaceae bacterium]|nr:cell division protein FtsL [Peptococcaceae bacterium]
MVVAQERYDHYSLPEEESRVTRRPKRNLLPGKGRYALTLLVLLTFCTGMLIAFYYSQVIISGYKIYSLNNKLTSLRQETVSLAEEVDRLNSLGRIEHLATTRLKMVKPGSRDVVVVKANLIAENSRGNPAGSKAEPGSVQSGQQARGRQDAAGRNKVVQAFANLIGIKGS